MHGKSIDMEDAWHNNELEQSEAKQWRSTIKAKIRDREEMQWRDAMQHKAKLRTYRQLKTELRFEEYLMTRDREAREVMTRLRGGTNELRIETGRYPVTNRDRPLDVSERRCLICMNGEIEDETHFMLDCEEYEDLRQIGCGLKDTLKEATTNRDREREKDGGREKENHGGSDGRVVYLRTRSESSSAAFLQAGNETRSGRAGSKDMRMWTILDPNQSAQKRKAIA